VKIAKFDGISRQTGDFRESHPFHTARYSREIVK